MSRPITRGINYITAHDGFTLRDLVSYTAKRNHANGEDNRDGSNNNLSWNNGAEGPSTDPAINAARSRDARALLATLLLSRGTPMLSMGDELGRTQHGNNNAYAQDNAGSWVDWPSADGGLIEFTAAVIALRRTLAPLFKGQSLQGRPVDGSLIADVTWLAADGQGINWNRDPGATLIAELFADDVRAVLIFHAPSVPVEIVLPVPRPGFSWRRVLESAEAQEGLTIAPRSVTVFQEATLAAETETIITDSGENIATATTKGMERTGESRVSIAGRALASNFDADLDRLADLAGIQPIWWDVDGGYHKVGADTKQSLLAAMRLPAATHGETIDSLSRITIEPRTATGGHRLDAGFHTNSAGPASSCLGHAAARRWQPRTFPVAGRLRRFASSADRPASPTERGSARTVLPPDGRPKGLLSAARRC